MKPTLIVLAAGMGSRYGGLKQIDGLGPSGETIMDYSIYDAIHAGFGKVVFVIRKDFADDFKAKVASKYEKHIPVEIVYQSINDLPEGFTCPPTREKPWGTNHAVMMACNVIHEPFAVINADDFYGRDSFRVLADELRRVEGKTNEYCMVGYYLGNTLSDSGTVARGICKREEGSNYLTDVVERTSIEKVDGKIVYDDENGNQVVEDPKTPVSMNMWGFTPDYFEHSEKAFVKFLKENIDTPKGEFYIPTVVNDLIKRNVAKCKVLETKSKWFGVTYSADRPDVVNKLQQLVDKGDYPKDLFSEFK